MFIFDRRLVPYGISYKYLGCSINENLKYGFTISTLAGSAGRALGSIVTKVIKNVRFPFKIIVCYMKPVFAQFWIMDQKFLVLRAMIQHYKYILGRPDHF